MFKLIMSNLSNKTIIIDLNEVRISIYSFIISLQFKIIIIKNKWKLPTKNHQINKNLHNRQKMTVRKI